MLGCYNGSMSLVQTAVTGFEEYGKIDTLFERDPSTFVVDELRLKQPVLATINQWGITEKIDGTNVRVMLSVGGEVSFGGRTNAAMLPADLIQYLIRTFAVDTLTQTLWLDAPTSVVLYGEGYGSGIQKGGGLYRPDKAFVLFDVLVDGKWWLEREDVTDIAAKLGIGVVPYLGRMSLSDIVTLVKIPFPSKFGTTIAEGIVARPIQTLFDRRGERLIIKLKTRDFIKGKR